MRRLNRSWLAMVAVTLVLAAALAVASRVLPAAGWIGLAALASLVKARLILLDYLGLRGVDGWRGGFMAGLAGLVVVVYGLLAVG
jgi:nitric oxide reductase NorF protein